MINGVFRIQLELNNLKELGLSTLLHDSIIMKILHLYLKEYKQKYLFNNMKLSLLLRGLTNANFTYFYYSTNITIKIENLKH